LLDDTLVFQYITLLRRCDIKRKNRDRMRLSRELKKQLPQESQSQTPISSQGSSSSSSSAFSTKQSRYRSLRRAMHRENISHLSFQVEYYNHLKQNLKKDQCIVHVDYSEGYSNKQQDEIQSAYFGHSTFSIFTVCGYYRPSDTVDLVKPLLAKLTTILASMHTCAYPWSLIVLKNESP